MPLGECTTSKAYQESSKVHILCPNNLFMDINRSKSKRQRNIHSRSLYVIFGLVPPFLSSPTYRQSRSSINFASICFWNKCNFLIHTDTVVSHLDCCTSCANCPQPPSSPYLIYSACSDSLILPGGAECRSSMLRLFSAS